MTTLDRCRAAYQALMAETGKVPAQSAVADAVGASRRTVSGYWADIIGIPTPPPTQKIEPAKRKCLACSTVFRSAWAGNRICGRCRGLESRRTAEHDYFLSF